MVAQTIELPNIHKLFIPDPGHFIAEADLSSAEAQVVAWEAGDQDLMEAFKAGLNVHIKNARDVFPARVKGWSDEAIKRTIDIARSKSLWVFSDECYEQLTYDQPFRSTFNICSDYDKILTFQSCSKTYAMTGWRIGYTCGNSEVIKAMSKL